MQGEEKTRKEERRKGVDEDEMKEERRSEQIPSPFRLERKQDWQA